MPTPTEQTDAELWQMVAQALDDARKHGYEYLIMADALSAIHQLRNRDRKRQHDYAKVFCLLERAQEYAKIPNELLDEWGDEWEKESVHVPTY